MSCGSCHRELPSTSAPPPRPEAERTYRARVGLPPWSPGRWMVLRLLLARRAPDAVAGLDERVRTLAHQVSRIATPRAEVAASAEALARSLDGIPERLDAVEWDEAEIRRTLRDLTAERARLAAVAGADERLAEQVVLGAYSLSSALIERDERALNESLVDALLALEKTLRETHRVDPDRFSDLLAQIEKEVR